MNIPDNNQDLLSQDKAESLADAFLKERHYDYEKVVFQLCEQMKASDQTIYRFSGLLIEKTRSLIDRLARDRSGVTFKFVIDVNAQNGKVLNYYLI